MRATIVRLVFTALLAAATPLLNSGIAFAQDAMPDCKFDILFIPPDAAIDEPLKECDEVNRKIRAGIDAFLDGLCKAGEIRVQSLSGFPDMEATTSLMSAAANDFKRAGDLFLEISTSSFIQDIAVNPESRDLGVQALRIFGIDSPPSSYKEAFAILADTAFAASNQIEDTRFSSYGDQSQILRRMFGFSGAIFTAAGIYRAIEAILVDQQES